MTESALCFGRFRLDLAKRQLLLDERMLPLGDRAWQVLCALAEANGALVSKDELMARVWNGQVVEENNLQVQISTLRKTLDPEGTGESWIVTVPVRVRAGVPNAEQTISAARHGGTSRRPAAARQALAGGTAIPEHE